MFFLWLLCAGYAGVQAQHVVKFTVKEKGTEQPMVAAVITYAADRQMQKPTSVLTDVEGHAVISFPERGMI